jgi:hypothetical protein
VITSRHDQSIPTYCWVRMNTTTPQRPLIDRISSYSRRISSLVAWMTVRQPGRVSRIPIGSYAALTRITPLHTVYGGQLFCGDGDLSPRLDSLADTSSLQGLVGANTIVQYVYYTHLMFVWTNKSILSLLSRFSLTQCHCYKHDEFAKYQSRCPK